MCIVSRTYRVMVYTPTPKYDRNQDIYSQLIVTQLEIEGNKGNEWKSTAKYIMFSFQDTQESSIVYSKESILFDSSRFHAFPSLPSIFSWASYAIRRLN